MSKKYNKGGLIPPGELWTMVEDEEYIISLKMMISWINRMHGSGDINWVSKEDGSDFI